MQIKNYYLSVFKPILKFLTLFLFSYFILFVLNINYLKNWSLSGDDLYSLSNSISDGSTLIDRIFNDFSGQYRHITYYLFHFYKPLLPNFLSIFLVHLGLLSLIPTLLFYILGKFKNIWLKYFIIFTFFLNPIFYYHTYTISSLANILICIITLILLYYFENRKKLLSLRYSILFLVLVLLSIAIKETFIVPLTIFCMVQLLQLKENTMKGWVFLTIPVTIFILYFVARTNTYAQNIPSDYYFVFNIKHNINNLLNMAAWMFNYPRGWQYGAPIRYPLIQPVISATSLLVFTFGFFHSLIKNKIQTLAYLLFLFASIVLFIFLNNVHLFYMDIPYLLVLIIFSKAIKSIELNNYNLAKILVSLLFIVNLAQFFLIKPQWLKYSFVANANKSAINYRKVLKDNEYQKYDQICISEHNRGSFGTEDGNLVNYLSEKKFKIISVKDSSLPEDCFNNHTLRLKNDAWSYVAYEK